MITHTTSSPSPILPPHEIAIRFEGLILQEADLNLNLSQAASLDLGPRSIIKQYFKTYF